MGATFGAGLSGSLPHDLSDEERFAVVEKFINAIGSPSEIREVIGDRVSEWAPHIEDNVMDGHDQRWLPNTEATPILDYLKTSSGSAPYSWFEYLDGWMVLIPGKHSVNRFFGLLSRTSRAISSYSCYDDPGVGSGPWSSIRQFL